MKTNDITQAILDTAFHVHTKLGPGLLESVYEIVLAYELEKRGLRVERQKPIAVQYDNLVFEEGFRADLLVEDKVIVELKSVETLTAVHPKQVLTYLRLSGKKVGLLLNFGMPRLKDGIERIINGTIED